MRLALLGWLVLSVAVGPCLAGKNVSNVQHPSGPGILLPEKISNYDFGTNKYNFLLNKGTEIPGSVLAVADFSGDGTHDLVVLKDSRLHFYLGSKTSTSFTKAAVSIPCKDECVFVHFGHFFGDPYDNPLNMLVTEKSTTLSGTDVFRHYFWFVRTQEKSKAKKNEFEVYAVEQAQTKPFVTRSLLLLVDFYSKMKIDFVGMDESNQLTVWSFGSSPSANWAVTPLLSDCKLAPFHQSHYVDINGDLFPDIVLVCSSNASDNAYLEYWLNESLPSKSPQRHFVRYTQFSSTSQEPEPIKDALIDDVTCLKIFDVFGTGINHLLVGTSNGHLIVYPNKVPFCSSNNDTKCFYYKGIGQLAITQEDLVTFGFSTTATEPKSLSIGHGNSIARIQFADINLDGYLDLAILLGEGKIKFAVFNLETHFYSLLEDQTLSEAYTLGGVGNLAFFHVDPNPSIDLLLNVTDPVDRSSKVFFLENRSSFDSFFIRFYPLDVPFDKIIHGRFSPPIPGCCVMFAVQLGKFDSNEGTYDRMRQILFNFWPSTTDPLSSLPSITFGLGRMNNFLPFITVSSPSGEFPTGENLKTWNSIIPNCKLIAYVPSRREQMWHILIYFNRSAYMVTVIIVVSCAVGTFGVIALICKLREMNEDKRERKKAVSLINFNAL